MADLYTTTDVSVTTVTESDSSSLWLSEDWIRFLSGVAFWLLVLILCSVCCKSTCRCICCDIPRDACAELHGPCPRWCPTCVGMSEDGNSEESSGTSADSEQYEHSDIESTSSYVLNDDPPKYEIAVTMPKPNYDSRAHNNVSFENPAFLSQLSDNSNDSAYSEGNGEIAYTRAQNSFHIENEILLTPSNFARNRNSSDEQINVQNEPARTHSNNNSGDELPSYEQALEMLNTSSV